MNATAIISATAPAVDPVYALRDELARVYNPTTAHERMLVTVMAQALQRLHHAYELERRVFAETGPLELFSSNLEAFKTIARHVAECERAWRRALAAIAPSSATPRQTGRASSKLVQLS